MQGGPPRPGLVLVSGAVGGPVPRWCTLGLRLDLHMTLFDHFLIDFNVVFLGLRIT